MSSCDARHSQLASGYERLTELWKEMERDEDGAEGEERLRDLWPAFVADDEAAQLVEPGEGTRPHPPMLAQSLPTDAGPVAPSIRSHDARYAA